MEVIHNIQIDITFLGNHQQSKDNLAFSFATSVVDHLVFFLLPPRAGGLVCAKLGA